MGNRDLCSLGNQFVYGADLGRNPVVDGRGGMGCGRRQSDDAVLAVGAMVAVIQLIATVISGLRGLRREMKTAIKPIATRE